jgi:uncharacterized protein
MCHSIRSLFTLLAGFLLLIALSAPSHAETPQCGGTDLLAKMKKEDRRAYDRIIAEGRKIPNAKGLFWKIEKRGLKPSYLFGTMHVADPRVLKMARVVKQAQRQASVTVLESDQLLDLGKARILAFTKPDMMMMPAGKRIEDFLTPDQKSFVNEALTARGAPLSAVNYLRPWMVANIFNAACKTPQTTEPVPVLDQQLAIDAANNMIPVRGLETLEEQYSAFNTMSLEAQVKSLLASITSASRLADADETTIELYSKGDLAPIQPLLRKISRDDTSMAADVYSEFEDAVVTRRNHVMAERVLPYVMQGNAFIAVGALHLQGEEGLVELLRKQGFKVKRAI